MGNDLSNRALSFIFDIWTRTQGRYPSNEDVALVLGKTTNHWGNIRRKLVSVNLLSKSEIWDFELTPKALSRLRNNEVNIKDMLGIVDNSQLQPQARTGSFKQPAQSLIYTELQLFADVKAGKDNEPDEFSTYPPGETVRVLHTGSDPNVYALKVVGESMMHDGIFPGDYVLVKKASITEIRENELVVAYYLSENYNGIEENELEENIENLPLKGPVLKRYFPLKKLGLVRLSWQKDAESNEEYKIETRYINPDRLGKVIAIYRPEIYMRI